MSECMICASHDSIVAGADKMGKDRVAVGRIFGMVIGSTVGQEAVMRMFKSFCPSCKEILHVVVATGKSSFEEARQAKDEN